MCHGFVNNDYYCEIMMKLQTKCVEIIEQQSMHLFYTACHISAWPVYILGHSKPGLSCLSAFE